MAAIIRVRDENGNVTDIPAIVGAPGRKGDPGKDGEPGEKGEVGGYYTPSVTQEDDTLRFSFAASEEDMPTVGDVTVSLPGGSVDLDTTLTQNGMAADAKAVGDALANVGKPTDEQIAIAVNAWLDEHPEATTTTKWGNIADGEIFELSTEEEPAVPVPCTGITLDKTELAFSDTETTVMLGATVTPFDTTDSIEWSVDNSGVATVENGVVTPIANGSCVITAKCGAYSATCAVTVKIVASYTKANLDGYFDFVGVEDGYSGVIANKAEGGTLQGEVYFSQNTNASNKNHYGGVESGVMNSGYTTSLGGYGSYDGFKVTQPDTGIFYSGYPYTFECYGAMSDGWSDAGVRTETFASIDLNVLNSPTIMNTRYAESSDTTSRPGAISQKGTNVVFADASTIRTLGHVGQGANTLALDSAVDFYAYHHYVVVMDSALARVYVDGVKVGEGTATNNTGCGGQLIPITSGKLKMCRVYNAILTDEQVANNYANTIEVYGGDA